MIVSWPRCPRCGAHVDCVGRADGTFSFRCKLTRAPSFPAPPDGHTFEMSEEELEEMQAGLALVRGRSS